MAYSSVDDIKKLMPAAALVALTDDEGLGTVNQGRVAEAIAQADAEVDCYCAGRYQVPFNPVPALIRKLSVDLALYNLCSRTMDAVPDVRSARYQNGIRVLEALASGSASLSKQEAGPAAARAVTNVTGKTNVFSRDKLESF